VKIHPKVCEKSTQKSDNNKKINEIVFIVVLSSMRTYFDLLVYFCHFLLWKQVSLMATVAPYFNLEYYNTFVFLNCHHFTVFYNNIF
jgi:hypothetical protein